MISRLARVQPEASDRAALPTMAALSPLVWRRQEARSLSLAEPVHQQWPGAAGRARA